MSQLCARLPAIRVEEIISNHRPVLKEEAEGGDGATFESLVAGHLREIRVLAGRLTGWDGEAEDIVQDVFAAALEGFGKFDGRSSRRTWLYRITINKCRAYRYKKFLRLQRLLRAGCRAESLPDRGAPEKMIKDENAQHIRQAVRALPARYREAIVLKYIEELSTEQITEILGISNAALNTRLSRARMMLGKKLSGLIGE